MRICPPKENFVSKFDTKPLPTYIQPTNNNHAPFRTTLPKSGSRGSYVVPMPTRTTFNSQNVGSKKPMPTSHVGREVKLAYHYLLEDCESQTDKKIAMRSYVVFARTNLIYSLSMSSPLLSDRGKTLPYKISFINCIAIEIATVLFKGYYDAVLRKQKSMPFSTCRLRRRSDTPIHLLFTTASVTVQASCNPSGQYQMLLPTDAYTGALQPTAAYCCLVNSQLYRIC
ncbi:hypothetical protein M011DRAFT_501257 [Sporormia fimetaria CBS 119925]|uniref:Uncharacterized protein n=1 Tax=Sporormia fimetaria CBS 119925 TaxID=1340428 RepID=A0A6A6VAN6_9PLEO|nr:hypothetical protein M011DRAFT_501257 [Sporormia fimetaria CBS 119925]